MFFHEFTQQDLQNREIVNVTRISVLSSLIDVFL